MAANLLSQDLIDQILDLLDLALRHPDVDVPGYLRDEMLFSSDTEFGVCKHGLIVHVIDMQHGDLIYSVPLH